MDKTQIAVVTVIVALVVLFVAAYFGVKKLIKLRKIRVGKNGEKKVGKELEKIARKSSNKFRVIHDIYLPLYDKTTQIDHIVIGKFGMVVVETKAMNGDIYGTEKDNDWANVVDEKKTRFYNPLFQNKTHVDCIRHILKKENIYRVDIDSLVVFSQKTAILNIPRKLPVITINLLKKYFKKSRYKQDNQVNVEKVYEALEKNRVTDKELIKQHNANVKKMAKGKY
ncbi:nuclease-related domain-containing protein [Massiliimalia massiliensis]|jgi:hypothetical protein|uniref:nuclease-related domain-containing protein n=1 Tax=Massiliimalia massiliensis TaxID=1852384 RepID=UPI0013564179|nr:nuclease-related domain-containing protein [Massiliimalia massiliensis]